jgi:amino acid adenylation domain-containing protein
VSWAQPAAPAARRWSLADTERSLPDAVAEQALKRATQPAIIGDVWSPTYGQLDNAANRIACALLERGAGAGTRVALLQRHGASLIVSALAALKTGAAVIALNVSDPPVRLRQLHHNTTPALLLTDAHHRPQALAAGFADEAILTIAERPNDAPHSAPRIVVGVDELALLLCTSGSTGRQLAVAQTHRNVLHNALRHSNGLGLRADDRIALLASPSGGQGAGTVWTTLTNGATLCPFPVMERGIAGLVEWVNATAVSVLVASPSLFRHFMAALDGVRLPGVRLVRVGSERALSGDYHAWRAHFGTHCLFVNTYSSTETGAIAQHLMGHDHEPGSGLLPAGRATEGTEIRVVAADGAELPPGEVGEIVVRARHLSPGYWNERALTASRFTGEADGARRFRTGDVGSLDADGVLTVLGRSDHVVKIRGNRVSLAEVETALGGCAGVVGAAVSVADATGEARLIAHVVTQATQQAPTARDLRRELQRTLPRHAVPSEFVFVEQLPLTAHGKLDRPKLADLVRVPAECSQQGDADCAPASERGAGGAPAGAGRRLGELPSGELEELIAALFSRVLDRAEVGREEDFFDLGGDSLAAAELAAAVHGALGVEIGLRAFAGKPTVSALAQLAQQRRSRAAGSPEHAARLICAGAHLEPVRERAGERRVHACHRAGARWPAGRPHSAAVHRTDRPPARHAAHHLQQTRRRAGADRPSTGSRRAGSA